MPDLKPSDAFVGVVELFAILLPGALLAVALIVAFGPEAPPLLRPLLATTGARWVGFALSAYALGHFVFLLASRLDEQIYEPRRKRRQALADAHADARVKHLPPPRGKEPRTNERAHIRVTKLRCERLPDVAEPPDDEVMNSFAWAKALLMLRAPGALTDVQRYEADSKFFRSLVIVIPLSALVMTPRIHPWPLALAVVGGALLLAWPSYLRYAERRYESARWAFYYVLVLCSEGALAAAP